MTNANHCIGWDAHKTYSVFVAIDQDGQASRPVTVSHEREEFRRCLSELPPASPIALETIGYWYWMVDEMEKAGHIPLLTDAKKAKHMISGRNKSDKLDARGLGILLHNGTLPTVWIADAEVRDQRELSRMRMALVRIQTGLKNRVHACFNRYGIALFQPSEAFEAESATELEAAVKQLPEETRYSVLQQLEMINQVRATIQQVQQRMKGIVKRTPEMRLLDTLPGVGYILSVVIAFEIGDIERFPTAGHLASYAGLVPRVYSSGGHTRYGSIAPDVNRMLRWAFIEAANIVCRGHERHPQDHLVRLYERIAAHKPESVAKVAVARELAQSAFWMLKKKEVYREPRSAASSSPR